ncbi:MAG: hypothetical protein ACN4GZ_18315 [Acidimicrobiales bacterium]
MPTVDWNVVRTAALSGLVLLVPLTLLSLWVIDDGSSSYAKLGFFGLTMFGFAAAGYGGGKLAPMAPMTHGALGAAGTWAIIQAFGVVRRLISGEEINVIGYPLQAMIAAGCGVFGAVFADWVRRSGRPTSVDELRSRLPR